MIIINRDFITQYMKDQGYTQKEFSDILGIGVVNFNRLLNRKSEPGTKTIEAFLRHGFVFEEVFSLAKVTTIIEEE